MYLIIEVIGIGLGLFFVWFSKEVIDQAISVRKEDLTIKMVLVVLSLLGNVSCSIFSGWLSDRYKIIMLFDLQSELKNRMMLWDWRSIEVYHTGDLFARFKIDNEEIVQFLSFNLWQGLINLVRCIAAAGFLYVFDPMLALGILIITPIIIISKFYFKKIRKLTLKLRVNDGLMAQVTQENLRLRLSIRGLHLLDERMKYFLDVLNSSFQIKYALLNYSTFSKTVLTFIINIGFLMTFIWGVWKLAQGSISFGILTAYLQLLTRIQIPTVSLISFVPLLIKFNTSLSRILEIYSSPIEESIPQYHFPSIEKLILKDISFAYADTLVLKSISLNIERGQASALIGSSGRGKSTLLRIICSQINPNTGQVWIQAGNKLYMSSINYRTNFTYVSQDDELFCGSIIENLRSSNPNCSLKDIHDVIKITCSEFVYLLPDGLDTKLGESGLGLSIGQIQRLIIARAILRESPVWLFDEITTALDRETSKQIIKNLLRVGSDKIIVFATHDKTVIEQCEHVINLH